MARRRAGNKVILGIDIGGSGIKGAPVDVTNGELLQPRYRIPTPQPAKPEEVGEVVAQLARHFKWKGPIGCAFPAVIKDGVAHTAANVDPSWIGTDGRALFEKKTGCPISLLNDADAAGIAEVEFGAGSGQPGIVVMVTLGTGIGSAIFLNGKLIPNSEIGHLTIRGKDSELRASDRAREKNKLSWKKWARRVDEYLEYVESLFWPDLFIIGGGVSKKHERFFRYINVNTPVVPAQMLNEAGIVGAAMGAKAELETGLMGVAARKSRKATRRRKKD